MGEISNILLFDGYQIRFMITEYIYSWFGKLFERKGIAIMFGNVKGLGI